MELAQHELYLCVLEVMQHLRADHDVHAGIGEGQTPRVGGGAAVENDSGVTSERLGLIDTERSHADGTSCRKPACANGNIRQTGADIQERRLPAEDRHDSIQLVEHGVRAAKQGIGNTNIAQRSLPNVGGRSRIIEMLEAAAAPWSDQRMNGNQRSSCA